MQKSPSLNRHLISLIVLIHFAIIPSIGLSSESEALSDEIEAVNIPSVQPQMHTKTHTEIVAPDISSDTVLKPISVRKSDSETVAPNPTEMQKNQNKKPKKELTSKAQNDPTVEPTQQAPIAKAFKILGTEIPPGMATRVAWRPGLTLKGLASQAPVLVVNGEKPGPTLCITAAVHGDELNGIEVVRQVLHRVKANKLSGTLIGVPIVNIQGFLRNSRYLVDRRDLNRFFPGTAHGSLASRIAHSFFKNVILNCSALVDIHTGSFYRDNLPQLRADLINPSVVKLTEGFGSTLVLHSDGAKGTLRGAAVEYNIPAITLELGGPMVLDEKAVEHGVEGLFNLLDSLKLYTKSSFWGTPKPVYFNSQWVRAEHGGIFFSRVKLGDDLVKGDLLGTITNPITNEQFLLKSPYEGQVVGLAHNQVVYPGFATTHMAIEQTKPPASSKSQSISNQDKEEETGIKQENVINDSK